MLNKPIIYVGLSLAIALCSTFIFIYIQAISKVPVQPQISWLAEPKPINDFELNSEKGTFSKADLLGHWTILLFGYTRCPDVCPTSLYELSLLANELTSGVNRQNINFVFVSVDPFHDNPTNLAQYVQYFHPTFIGTTGNTSSLSRLANSLGIRFSQSLFKETGDFTHSVYFSLISPEGQLVGRFQSNFDVSALADDINNRLTTANSEKY